MGRVDVERAKVAVTPLYLAFSDASDLDPEVSGEVLTAVLGTMSIVERVGYAGRLEQFTESHRERLAQLYAQYGPRSRIAVHGRYSLLHSPTSIAVLERLAAAPSAFRAEWEHAELPPAWLEGLATAWRASVAPPGLTPVPARARRPCRGRAAASGEGPRLPCPSGGVDGHRRGRPPGPRLPSPTAYGAEPAEAHRPRAPAATAAPGPPVAGDGRPGRRSCADARGYASAPWLAALDHAVQAGPACAGASSRKPPDWCCHSFA